VSADTVIYRGMNRAELDAAYNNSEAVADSPQWLARWREASARVRARPDARLDIVYGEQPRARLDYFPSGTVWPVLFLFIHGGYWQRNEKETFAFVAEGPLRHGIDVATVGYTLAPDASLTEIVGEIHQALDYLCAHADALGFDAERIYVGGWSAGGHLTAAAATHPAFCGGLPISGIFDLEPIALNYLNEKLKLTPPEIAALSPLRHLSHCHKPLRLAVGGNELPELRRQSELFARAASARDLAVQLTVLDGHHHFSILDELARPDGALTRELLALIGRT
jgi:arylformamidase